jgi:transposase
MVPIAQAATEFGLSERTLYLYIGQGRLKRYKRGMDRKSYVDRRELRRLLAYRVDKPKR